MILHVDMDAFFTSIEQRDNPELKGKPIIVGGLSKRGVVSAASYEARKFGIYSAMPIFQALKKYPGLIVVPVNKNKYAGTSQKIMKILKQYTPLVEPVSIDEAFLDITGCERLLGSHKNIAIDIKKRIKKELFLTCSIGVAPVKFLAKIASDMNKPNCITIIEKHEAKKFVLTVDIKKVPGVGEKAIKQMKILNIKTLGDINKFSLKILYKKFGKLGEKLFKFAQCIDNSKIKPKGKRKSISSETTLANDTVEMEVVKKNFLYHAQILGEKLRNKNFFTTNISIKLKFNDFSQITRQKKLKLSICSSSAIYKESLNLIKNLKINKKIRLIGISVSGLSHKKKPVQIDMFEQTKEKIDKWEKIDKTIDCISKKFGSNIIKKATLK
ncbi:MAG: DNA polymerase IV [Desulfobacteraceae bacterium 4572_130]|nr:MAG: DNA polymerase IV [Desulfobacteraceae bacterium 4572_130]